MAKSEYQHKGHTIFRAKDVESGKYNYRTMDADGQMQEYDTLHKAKKSIDEVGK